MLHRNVALSALLLVLVIAGLPRFSIATAGGFDWSAVAVEDAVAAADGNETATETSDGPQKNRGNGFVRALSAPFRALGRLFGGRKKNQQQARRISAKDAARFESTKLTRIKDSSIDTPTAGTSSVPASAIGTHLERGRELLNSGDVNGAIAELTTAASIDPKSGEVNKLLGIAYESKGLRGQALQAFEVALHADEDNAEHLNNLGYLLYKNGDYERATKYLKRAAKLAPNNARIWNNLGLAQCQRGKFDDAYESFVHAVGEFGGRMNVAAQLLQRGYANEAIKHLEKAQALRPDSTEVLTKLVSVYEMTGRLAAAENARRSLVALRTFADANK